MTDSDTPPEGFVLKNQLEELLEDAVANPARRAAFETMLLHSDLYAATPDAPGTVEAHIFQPGDRVRLRNVALADGQQLPALFTSEARLTEFYGDGVGFVTMKGLALLELVQGFGAVLNPGFAHGVHWTPANLAALLGKPVGRVLGEETQVGLGIPAERPEALIATLERALGMESRVQEAWLALAHWPDRDELAWYLDIGSTSSREELAGMITDMMRSADLGGRPLDVIVHPPTGEPGHGIRIKPREER